MSSTTTVTPIGSREATEGVTENESEAPGVWPASPPSLTTEQLQEARWLPLSATAGSPGAAALVAEIAGAVASHEVAARTRRSVSARAIPQCGT